MDKADSEHALLLGTFFLVAMSFAACAETAEIRSQPPGARISINGEYVGETPTDYRVKRSELSNIFHYRAELPGYAPAEGTLQTRVSAGRIVGMIFSLGISAAFRPPQTMRRLDIDMKPLDAAVAPGPELTIEQRLERLDALHSKGLVSEAEYQSQRTRLLEGL